MRKQNLWKKVTMTTAAGILAAGMCVTAMAEPGQMGGAPMGQMQEAPSGQNGTSQMPQATTDQNGTSQMPQTPADQNNGELPGLPRGNGDMRGKKGMINLEPVEKSLENITDESVKSNLQGLLETYQKALSAEKELLDAGREAGNAAPETEKQTEQKAPETEENAELKAAREAVEAAKEALTTAMKEQNLDTSSLERKMPEGKPGERMKGGDKNMKFGKNCRPALKPDKKPESSPEVSTDTDRSKENADGTTDTAGEAGQTGTADASEDNA